MGRKMGSHSYPSTLLCSRDTLGVGFPPLSLSLQSWSRVLWGGAAVVQEHPLGFHYSKNTASVQKALCQLPRQTS